MRRRRAVGQRAAARRPGEQPCHDLEVEQRAVGAAEAGLERLGVAPGFRAQVIGLHQVRQPHDQRVDLAAHLARLGVLHRAPGVRRQLRRHRAVAVEQPAVGCRAPPAPAPGLPARLRRRGWRAVWPQRPRARAACRPRPRAAARGSAAPAAARSCAGARRRCRRARSSSAPHRASPRASGRTRRRRPAPRAPPGSRSAGA